MIQCIVCVVQPHSGFSFGGNAPIVGAGSEVATPTEEKKAPSKKKATSKGAAVAVAKKEAKKAKAASKKGGSGKAVKEVSMTAVDGTKPSDEIEPVTLNAPPPKHKHTKQSYVVAKGKKKTATPPTTTSSGDAYDFAVLDQGE
jgi:hypothetical protein